MKAKEYYLGIGQHVNERLSNQEFSINDYQIMVAIRLQADGERRQVRIDVFKDEKQKDLVLQDDIYYFFFNRSLLEDSLVQSLFESRDTDEYQLTLTREEGSYLGQMAHIIDQYQKNEDSDLGAHFVANMVSQVIMITKLALERPPYEADKTESGDRKNMLASRFMKLVSERHKNNKRVVFYAEKLSVGVRTLANATNEVLGYTPKELIDQATVKEGKRLLSETQRSVKDISFELGFDEENNFSSFFKKMAKITPTQYRKDKNPPKK